MSTRAECLETGFAFGSAVPTARKIRSSDVVGFGWLAAGAAYLFGLVAVLAVAL